MKKTNEYDTTKELLNKIRSLNENKKKKKNGRLMGLLKESDDKKDNKEDDGDSIAITDEPKFGNNVLQNQISAFKEAVNGGAKFSTGSGDAKSNPLVFFPKTGNLVFSGSIPSLSGLKFQFSLNDVTNSPYIFVDGLALTEDTVTTLNKLRGFYLNWRDEWNAAGDLLDKLSKPKED